MSEIKSWMDRSSIESSLYSIDQIFKTGIFSSHGSGSLLFQCAITQVLIDLNDALQKASDDGRRIDFKGDDIYPCYKENDLTSLISTMRNCACHVSTKHQVLNTNVIRFCSQIGKGVLIKIGDTHLENPYDDDIAIFYGEKRLFIKRNIIVAVQAIREIYQIRIF